MKSNIILYIVILVFSVSLTGQNGSAGNVGFTNIDAIVFNLPEIEDVNSDLEAYRSALSDQVNIKTEQFNLFVDAFQKLKDDPTTPDSILQAKQVDFLNRQKEVQNFRGEAEQLYSNKQAELLNPLYQKVYGAIEEVRKDKGFGIIINSHAGQNAGIILAYGEETDITRAVFEKMGVPFPENIDTEPIEEQN